MVYLQFQQLSSVLFWVNTIITKSFANILDILVIQNRHNMSLSAFAAETKSCQGLVCLSGCALELLTCPSSLTNGLRLPQESQHKQKWEASHPHAFTPASELRPAFYLETFFQTGHPPLVLPQAVFPIHYLGALQPFSSYHLSNLGSR